MWKLVIKQSYNSIELKYNEDCLANALELIQNLQDTITLPAEFIITWEEAE